MADEPTATAWLDLFFSSYYRHRPVNATFIGLHDFDDCLPDFSDHAAGDALADSRALQSDAAALLAATSADRPITASQRIDLRLATGFLEIQDWELQSSHFHRGNPSLYTGEAIFGVMSLFLSDFAPLEQRVAAAAARLNGFPALFKQAIANVAEAPAAWTERAIRECGAGLVFLTEGITLLAGGGGADWTPVQQAARKAAVALADYRRHLDTETRHRPNDRYGAGEEALARYLTLGHCLDPSADAIAEYAEAELARARGGLDSQATDPAPATQAGRDGPEYDRVWLEARAAALEHQLVTWPDFPIRYGPRPAWAAKAANDLYFLCYRSPAAVNRPAVHEYLVPPNDPGPSAVKLNHVVHHGGLGHHVQNWYAFRAESRVGRMAAVDGASRIAMFCGGTMAEGWACYATDLMSEVGYLTAAEQLEERRTRARMCARAVVDIRLHQGRLTLGQAAEYYQTAAGMPPAAARAEAVKNSMFPGAAVMYVAGTDRIHQLRKELSARQGDRFSLQAFHDRFLSYGSIPVALIADAMVREADATQ